MFFQPITHLAWKVRRGIFMLKHKPSRKLRSTSSSKRGSVFSSKSAYMILPRQLVHVVKPIPAWILPDLFWNEEHWVMWGVSSAHSHRLWRLFTSLLENAASSVYNPWHKKSDSYVALCRSHQQNWRWRLLFPGCSPWTSYTWKGHNYSSYSVHVTWGMVGGGLACTASNTSSSFCTLHLPQPSCEGGSDCIVLLQTHLLGYLQSGCWCSSSISVIKAVQKICIDVLRISKSCHLVLLSLLCHQK
jgi:hypothetical protein